MRRQATYMSHIAATAIMEVRQTPYKISMFFFFFLGAVYLALCLWPANRNRAGYVLLIIAKIPLKQTKKMLVLVELLSVPATKVE